MNVPERPDPLSRLLLAIRDWTYDHYYWAFVVGTAVLCRSFFFPSLTWTCLGWVGCLVLGALLEPCVNPYRQLFGRSLWKGSGEKVALTFDDGPGPDTAALLDLLKAHGARATFFCVGSAAEQHPDLIDRMRAEGHEVGNHTWSHANLLRSSPAATRRELSQTQEVLRGAVRWWRPPFGYRAPWSYPVARKLGLEPVLWSVNPRDFQNPGAEVIVQRTLAELHEGMILLLHDGPGERSQTLVATEQLLGHLRERGLQAVTVSELDA